MGIVVATAAVVMVGGAVLLVALLLMGLIQTPIRGCLTAHTGEV